MAAASPSALPFDELPTGAQSPPHVARRAVDRAGRTHMCCALPLARLVPPSASAAAAGMMECQRSKKGVESERRANSSAATATGRCRWGSPRGKWRTHILFSASLQGIRIWTWAHGVITSSVLAVPPYRFSFGRRKSVDQIDGNNAKYWFAASTRGVSEICTSRSWGDNIGGTDFRKGASGGRAGGKGRQERRDAEAAAVAVASVGGRWGGYGRERRPLHAQAKLGSRSCFLSSIAVSPFLPQIPRPDAE